MLQRYSGNKMNKHRFPKKWMLDEVIFTKDKGTVFSCFSGGGGSTMGYKLAGYDVIGCNEMDERMMECYIVNHRPKFSYCESIKKLRRRDDLPDELFDLDILDGSPPCCAFSLAGKRDQGWGEKRKFRSNMKAEVIDTLFFDFVKLTKKLQPKIVVAENVPAILVGDAIQYTNKICEKFKKAGYYIQYFVLNASRMGVPQKRRRIFFIGLRKDLAGPFLINDGLFESKPEIKFRWNEPKIRFREIRSKVGTTFGMTERLIDLLSHKIKTDKDLSDINLRLYDKLSGFTWAIVKDFQICPTPTTCNPFIRDYDNLCFSDSDYASMTTYPLDYNYRTNTVQYVAARSVPPIMMAQISTQIYKQWLSKINKKR
jgi:DNA (cytosine-5)-methyltransferase 1